MSISFISDAMAAAAPAAATVTSQQPAANNITSIIMLIAFIAMFYFLLIRPQQKRAKDHKKLMSELSKGDEVLTSGGIAGKVAKVGDDFVAISLNDTVEVTFQKSAVVTILPKGTLKSL